MRRLTALILLLWCSVIWAHQPFSEDYTYQKDCSFPTIEQLTGYTFVPQAYVEGVSSKTDVTAGEVQIHFSDHMVFFKGVKGLYNFNIMAKKQNANSYQFDLANSRGSSSGFVKLKIILDKAQYAKAIYVYSPSRGEYTFFLPTKSDLLLQQERQYFTHQQKLVVDSLPKLMAAPIKPYQKAWFTKNEMSTKALISMKKAFSFQFNEKSVVVNLADKQDTYKVKRIKEKKYTNERFPAVHSVLMVKIKEKPKHIKVYLTEQREVAFIQMSNMRYFLMK